MVMDILRLDLAIILVSKHLNRVEKINPYYVAVNSADPRVSLFTWFCCVILCGLGDSK